MPADGISGDSLHQDQGSGLKKVLIVAIILLFILWGASKYYPQGPHSVCDKFRGEKELCILAAGRLTAVFNQSIVYDIEKYRDENYTDAWLIYLKLPSAVINPEINGSVDRASYIFDKKTQYFYFHGYLSGGE